MKNGHLRVKLYSICVSGADGSHFVGFEHLPHTSVSGKEVTLVVWLTAVLAQCVLGFVLLGNPVA